MIETMNFPYSKSVLITNFGRDVKTTIIGSDTEPILVGKGRGAADEEFWLLSQNGKPFIIKITNTHEDQYLDLYECNEISDIDISCESIDA
jgi:hypothetical protein